MFGGRILLRALARPFRIAGPVSPDSADYLTESLAMHAIIRTGGKQYRVAEGQTLRIESLPVSPGDAIELNDVLMISDAGQIVVGTPQVAGAKVMATVLANGRGPKIRIVKFRRRKHHRKQMGHRQNFTQVQITSIVKG